MDGAGKTWKELAVIGFLEAMGTAILLIGVNFNNGNPLVLAAAILTGAILSGKLTGAHFNCAVTIGVFITEDASKRRGNIKLALVLMVSQIIGAWVGQLYSYMELGADGIAVLAPSNPDDMVPWKVFLVETCFTFILVASILHNIFPRLTIQADNVLAVTSVVTAVYFCCRCCGASTGACFNPAVALSNVPLVALVRKGTDLRDFKDYLGVYIAGPMAGAIIAALFCKYLVMPYVPEQVYEELKPKQVEDDGKPNYLPPTMDDLIMKQNKKKEGLLL